MAKLFNALNGKELQALVTKEVQQQLLLDSRFDGEMPITAAQMVWTLQVESYPSDGAPMQVQVSQVFRSSPEAPVSPARLRTLILERVDLELSRDIRFSTHLTYPKVTYRHLLDLTLTRPDGGVVQRPQMETSRLDHPADSFLSASEDRIVDLRSGARRAEASRTVVVAPPIDPREARVAELRRQIAELEGGSAEPAVTTVLSPSETRHRDFNPITVDGLSMDYGFRPSPGLEAAGSYGRGAPVGQIQSKEAIENIVLGVTHPPLDEGGMGAPDLVRRDAGLPVPQPTAVRGGTFDIPLGTF